MLPKNPEVDTRFSMLSLSATALPVVFSERSFLAGVNSLPQIIHFLFFSVLLEPQKGQRLIELTPFQFLILQIITGSSQGTPQLLVNAGACAAGADWSGDGKSVAAEAAVR